MARAQHRRAYEAPLNVDIPIELYESLGDFCDTRKVKKKLVVEAALRRFLAAEEGKRK